MKETIGMMIAFGFPLLGIAALIYLSIVGPKHRALVDKELFTPYLEAVAAGRYAEARKFHDAAYQQKHSLEAFKEHYQTMAKDFGPFKSHEVNAARGSFNPFSNASGFTVDCTLSFEKSGIKVNFGTERAPDGRLLIHSSGVKYGRLAGWGRAW